MPEAQTTHLTFQSFFLFFSVKIAPVRALPS